LYLKSLLVFVLCTLFVLGFVVVLNYVTAGVGSTPQGTSTSPGACPIPALSVPPPFEITSPALHTVNYTDELGIVSYATLTFGVNASSGSPLSSLLVCLGSDRAGTVEGPFSPSVNRVVNLTLAATISVSPGKTYVVDVEGFSEGGSAFWDSVDVTAS